MTQRKLTPQDIHRFALVGEPQFSPNGQEILFVRQETSVEDNKAYSTLWLMDSAGSNQQALTHGTKRDRSPRWSPDGQQIAFVSGRSEQSAIWILPRAGGEAWELTTEMAVSSAPLWSPDGQKIAFTARAYPHPEDWVPYPGAPADDGERARKQAEKALSAKKGNDDLIDVKVITRLQHKMDGVGYFGDLRSQIFVVELPKTPGAKPSCRQVTCGDYDHTNPVWSNDSQELLFSACREEDADLLRKQDLWKVDVATCELGKVLTGEGYVTPQGYSPDGQWLAFVGTDGKYGGSTSSHLWLIPADGPTPKEHASSLKLTEQLDRPVLTAPSSDVRYASSTPGVRWTEDSSSIYFMYGQKGSSCLAKLDVATHEITNIWQDPLRVLSAFDFAADGRVVMQIDSTDQVAELIMLQEGSERPLTAVNAPLYQELSLAKAKRFTYKGSASWDVDGWVLTPPDWQGDERLPTVLFIHGGPHGVYGSSFMFQAQLLASNGMAVVYTNPRGSQTYGQDFAYAVVEDWGGHDFQDIMLGVDYCIEQGIADAERLGVTGWSYGGYMTCWTVTQTNRFKAAIAGACVANRHNFYGTSDIGYFFGEHHFGGTPWDEPLKLLEGSAIHHVHKVTTPLMLVHGESDLRCPVEQSEQFFTALKRQGKEAVMIRYPGEFHGIAQPRRKEDRYKRLQAWFEHYLAN